MYTARGTAKRSSIFAVPRAVYTEDPGDEVAKIVALKLFSRCEMESHSLFVEVNNASTNCLLKEINNKKIYSHMKGLKSSQRSFTDMYIYPASFTCQPLWTNS